MGTLKYRASSTDFILHGILKSTSDINSVYFLRFSFETSSKLKTKYSNPVGHLKTSFRGVFLIHETHYFGNDQRITVDLPLYNNAKQFKNYLKIYWKHKPGTP